MRLWTDRFGVVRHVEEEIMERFALTTAVLCLSRPFKDPVYAGNAVGADLV
jgi:hypothetical protein